MSYPYTPPSYDNSDALEDYRRRQAEEKAQREAEAEEKKARTLAEIERRKQVFKAHAASFGEEIETALASQARLLHGLFTQALEEYAQVSDDELGARIHGAIALKAQQSCLATLAALSRVKDQKLDATLTRKIAKIEDPAIQMEPTALTKEENHAEMDAGIAQNPSGENTPVATVAHYSPENS